VGPDGSLEGPRRPEGAAGLGGSLELRTICTASGTRPRTKPCRGSEEGGALSIGPRGRLITGIDYAYFRHHSFLAGNKSKNVKVK
jgi:hypothetical protein